MQKFQQNYLNNLVLFTPISKPRENATTMLAEKNLFNQMHSQLKQTSDNESLNLDHFCE